MIAIYHSRDLDGIASGRAIKEKYPEATLVGYHYGEQFDIEIGEENSWLIINGTSIFVTPDTPIIMADVSLPMEKMDVLFSNFYFRWMDHHASAIKDFEDYFGLYYKKLDLGEAIGVGQGLAYLIDGTAACVVTWGALFGEAIPMGIDLLGDYDVWNNHDKVYWEKVLQFQYGMRGHSVENFPWDSMFMLDKIDEIKQKGKIILEYQCEQDAIAAKGAFEVEFEGYRAIAMNTTRFNSQAFESVYDPDKHDLMIPFRYTGDWSYSLYTTKDIDCSALAKKYGGGGHKQAAGFKLRLNLFSATLLKCVHQCGLGDVDSGRKVIEEELIKLMPWDIEEDVDGDNCKLTYTISVNT